MLYSEREDESAVFVLFSPHLLSPRRFLRWLSRSRPSSPPPPPSAPPPARRLRWQRSRSHSPPPLDQLFCQLLYSPRGSPQPVSSLQSDGKEQRKMAKPSVLWSRSRMGMHQFAKP
jgi:hypothetical protein